EISPHQPGRGERLRVAAEGGQAVTDGRCRPTPRVVDQPPEQPGFTEDQAPAGVVAGHREAGQELADGVLMLAAIAITLPAEGSEVTGQDMLGGRPIHHTAFGVVAHRRSSPSPQATSRSWSMAIIVYRYVELESWCPR